jgi:hypothetical protein
MDYKMTHIRIPITPFYNRRFEAMKLQLGMTNQELLSYLMDNYTLDDSLAPINIKRGISKRIAKGIDTRFIISLRILYTYIGHVLYRIDNL